MPAGPLPALMRPAPAQTQQWQAQQTVAQTGASAGGVVLVLVAVMLVAVLGVVVLAGMIFVAWPLPVDGSEGPITVEDDRFMLMRITDAGDEVSTADNDTLLRVGWYSADEDLPWSLVNVGDNVHTCSAGGTEDREITQSGDSAAVWEPDEVVFLAENGVDISGDGPAGIRVGASCNGKEIAGGGRINEVAVE